MDHRVGPLCAGHVRAQASCEALVAAARRKGDDLLAAALAAAWA
jgi:hypothetical protein